MFECKYKFELEDSIKSAKYVYKSQRRTKDKVLTILIPILIVLCVGLLILDIVNKKPIVWDVILIIALCVLQIISFILPLMVTKTQKKSYEKQNLANMDYLLITFDKNLCIEKMFKDDEEKTKLVHNLKNLTSYLEDNDRIVLVFNDFEFVCIRKDKLSGDVNEFKNFLYKTMSKNTNKKK